jgi:acyl phosphate:glycerol-3-phosphate acyltransferase
MSSLVITIARYVGATLAGYLLGSVPSGVVAARVFGRTDPRQSGSGKTGATNILRTVGPGAAVMVAATDIFKGVAAVLLARYVIFPGQVWAESFAGFAALLGHNYSVFIKFKGGRGVATGGGVILAMQPLALAVGAVGFVVPVAATRYVSLGSVVGASTCAVTDAVLVAAPKSFPIHDTYQHLVFMTVGAAFVVFSHRDNIQRLAHGTERKLGDKTEPVASAKQEVRTTTED